MADVGEEAALDLVQFHQLLVAFLQHFPALIQLEAQREFAHPEHPMDAAAGNHDDARQAKEVEVVKKAPPLSSGSGPCKKQAPKYMAINSTSASRLSPTLQRSTKAIASKIRFNPRSEERRVG